MLGSTSLTANSEGEVHFFISFNERLPLLRPESVSRVIQITVFQLPIRMVVWSKSEMEMRRTMRVEGYYSLYVSFPSLCVCS